MSTSTVWDITIAVKPPRPCFIDFPIGCPIGKPGMPELQRQILRAILAQAHKFGAEWMLHELPFQWSEDGNRAWEESSRTSIAAASAPWRRMSPTIAGAAKYCSVKKMNSRCAAIANSLATRH